MEFLRQLLFSLIAATLLAAFALWRKALTPCGLTLAWLLAIGISFFGGPGGFLILTATLFFTMLAGKISRPVREPLERQKHAKTGSRDAVQVFCNVFVGAFMMLLYGLGSGRCFLWAYSGAMAASLADSMASELGVLSKRTPVDICTLRPVEKGLSGGVTLFGFGASLAGAVLIAGICALFWGGERCGVMLFGVTAAGFLAALSDSLMGSALQAKYRCPVCGALTERRNHCGVSGNVERGFRAVTNDAVNFCNNLTGAGVGALLWLLLER